VESMLSFLLYGILGFQELKLSLLEPNQPSVEQVYTAELQSSPYVKMKGVPSTFTTLFGEYQAATILKKYNPDFVIMDVKMPILDGLKAAKVITEEKLSRGIVLLTAYSNKEFIEEAKNIGIIGYIVKPI